MKKYGFLIVGVLVIGVVLMSILIGSSLYAMPSGEATRTKFPPAYDESKCIDSDNGIDLKEQGTTQGKYIWTFATKTDYCNRAGDLVEFYCSRSKVKKVTKDCGDLGKDYKCENGVCVKEAWCEDSDNGLNYFIKGVVNSNIYPNGKEDYCYPNLNGETYLFEGRCKNGKYSAIQKNCNELGAGYECVEGTCFEVCKTYEGPGTFDLLVCDKVVYNNYEFEVLGFGSTDVSDRVMFKIKKEIPNKGILEYDYYQLTEDYGTIFSHHPFFTEFNANILAQEINIEGDNNYATISFDESCGKIYNYCKWLSEISEFPLNSCDWICSFDYKIPEREYYEDSNFILSMPNGYSQIADLILKNSHNCFDKIIPLLGITPYKKVSIIYEEKSYSGCSGGNFFEKVICQISLEYNDLNLVPQIEFNDLLEEKKCVHYINTPFSSMSHEITHNFAHNNFRSLNEFLLEGIADYVRHEVSTGIPNVITCTSGGYYFSLSPNELHEYGPLNQNSHYEGLCFIRDLKETYGEEKLKELFSYSGQQKNGCYFLFADIINPVMGEDVFSLFKEKYKIDEDPYKCFKGYFS